MVLFPIFIGGCASIGEKVALATSGQEIPAIGKVLDDLEENDAIVDNFRGRGVFIIESPNLDGKRKFRGNLKFQRPDSLFIQGNKLGGAIIVFRMISVGSEFLMEFPGDRGQSFYQLEGEEFVDVPFSVSPSDVAREMFLPENWKKVKKRSIQITAYDEELGILTVEMTVKRRLKRRLELRQVDSDAPRWVITRNIRFDENGKILGLTDLTNFSKVDNALLPGKVDSYFPTENTRMTFTLKDIQLNKGIDATTFDILARARELNLQLRTGETSGR